MRVLQHLVNLWPGEKARTEGLVLDAFGQFPHERAPRPLERPCLPAHTRLLPHTGFLTAPGFATVQRASRSLQPVLLPLASGQEPASSFPPIWSRALRTHRPRAYHSGSTCRPAAGRWQSDDQHRRHPCPSARYGGAVSDLSSTDTTADSK